MKKITIAFVLLTLFIAGCKKADFNDNSANGEGLVNFTMISPASGMKVALNSAVPNTGIEFSWNSAKPGLYEAPTYKVLMLPRSGGDFSTPLLSFPADNSGAATKLTLTYQQLDDALKAKGIANGIATELMWSVQADNGDKQIMAQTNFFITVTRFKDGATPFKILGPASSTAAISISPASTTDNVKFNWQRSRPATGGPAVTYKVLFAKRTLDANGNEVAIDWATQTLFRLTADNNGADSTGTYTQKRLNDSLAAHGYADNSIAADLKWTVEATSGNWSQLSDYQNVIIITRLIKYVYPQALNVAGNYQGWAPETAPQLVALSPTGGPYTNYEGFIDFNTAAPEFKIVKGDNWGAGDYGGAGGVLTDGGSNFTLPSQGVYLMRVNTGAMTYSADKIDRMGIIGSATPDGWNSDLEMTYNTTTQKYVITLNLVAGEIKFRINNDWPINLGDFGANGSLELGGDNIAISTPGSYTVSLSLMAGGNWSYSAVRN